MFPVKENPVEDAPGFEELILNPPNPVLVFGRESGFPKLENPVEGVVVVWVANKPCPPKAGADETGFVNENGALDVDAPEKVRPYLLKIVFLPQIKKVSYRRLS